MKKKYSLKSKISFNNILKEGKKIQSPYFLISYVRSSDFKIGISVPKKLGNAVFRNYNKRIIKQIIPKINVYTTKANIVIVVREKFTNLTIEQKKKILLENLNRIN